jgi:Undecaprenyl-phosphate galactose phosphotransferase WbaP
MTLVYELNERDTAYVEPPLRSYDLTARSRRPLLTPALRSLFRRATVAGALALGDALVVLSVLRLSGLVLAEHRHFPTLGNKALEAGAVLIVIFWAAGLYTGVGPSPCERLRLRTLGVLAFCAIRTIWAVHAEMPVAAYPWFAVEVLLLVIAGHYVELYVRGWLQRQGVLGAPTLIVGAGPAAQALFQALTNEPALGLRPIALQRLPAEENRSESPNKFRSIADRLILTESPEVAVVAAGSKPCDLENYFGMLTGPKKVLMVVVGEHLHNMYAPMLTLGTAIGIEISNAARLARYRWGKRLLDLLISLPAAILALPLVGILALVIKLTFRETALFTQERMGLEGHIFRVFKIRSMYGDAEHRLAEHLERHPEARAQWERFFKLSNDPRILPILGSAIRRWSLDELPQLWNVIRGDMSLVGPRPFPEYHTIRFDEDFRLLRAKVLPGLTGLWQVSSRSDGDLGVQRAQDLFYIRNQCFWLDLYILLQTIPAVLTAKGAR